VKSHSKRVKTKGFYPLHAWAKTFVFLPDVDHQPTDRCFLYACYGNPVMHQAVIKSAQTTLGQPLSAVACDLEKWL
jgi:hypothetical protein